MEQLDQQLVVLFVFLVLLVFFSDLQLLLFLNDVVHDLGGLLSVFLGSRIEGFEDGVSDC